MENQNKQRSSSNGGGGGRGGRGGRGGGRGRGRGGGGGRGRGGGGGRGRSSNGRGGGRGRGRSPVPNNNNNNNDAVVDRMEIDTEVVVSTSRILPPPPSPSTDNTASKSRHQFSETTFDSVQNISAPSKRALKEVLQYEYMTKVQEATLPVILQGHDVVAKAKTGSGKTTAFLLPIIERISTQSPNNNTDKFTAVVLSPTRELATQIATEFKKLATFHPQQIQQNAIITMIGGTNIDKDKRLLEKNRTVLRLLVATPGRLQDHLTQNTANLVDRLSQVQILCLDEADRLLDMGFRNELEKIMNYMPHSFSKNNNNNNDGQRQTLLFSATFPAVMQDITKLAMRNNNNYKLIDTLDPNDDQQEGQVNKQVVQKVMVTPLSSHLLALETILQDHIQQQQQSNKKTPFKIMVFYTTARIAGYMAELFRADPRFPTYTDATLLEMHSRKSQGYRTKTANTFHKGSNLILFTSDVNARGVDYENVTLVVQVGAPSSKEQYIHRLGRTARAGNAGTGILLLCDFERSFLKEMQDLLPNNDDDDDDDDDNNGNGNNNKTMITKSWTAAETSTEQAHLQQLLSKDKQLCNSAGAAYQAFLGYYNSNVKRFKINGKKELVQLANEYATVIGFPRDGPPPALQAKTVGKMGLKGVEGLNIERGGGGGGGNGGGERGGRGGGRGGGGGGRGRGRGGNR
jgi:ATP-dependent RNA helicase MSS116, mitochondrial